MEDLSLYRRKNNLLNQILELTKQIKSCIIRDEVFEIEEKISRRQSLMDNIDGMKADFDKVGSDAGASVFIEEQARIMGELSECDQEVRRLMGIAFNEVDDQLKGAVQDRKVGNAYAGYRAFNGGHFDKKQ